MASDPKPERPPVDQDPARVASRAELLPEEAAVGSDAPERQARAVLEDSEARTKDRDAAPDSRVEHRGDGLRSDEPAG
ncbi:MAG TPA: hypothetical protein VFP54_07710 [Acidimicrobiales bacterium]|nr:hypothetical protein [Acidimicrobiales bacterium]